MKIESRIINGKIEALSKIDGKKIQIDCGSFTALEVAQILEKSFGISIGRSKAYKGGNIALFADNEKPKIHWVENAFGVRLGEFDGDIVFSWWRNDVDLTKPTLSSDDYMRISSSSGFYPISMACRLISMGRCTFKNFLRNSQRV